MKIHACIVERDTGKVISVAEPVEVAGHYMPVKITVPFRIRRLKFKRGGRRLAVVVKLEGIGE